MKSPSLQLHSALGHEAADKRIDILRRVGDAGSISEAARNAGVSYKAAWQAIDTLSNLAGTALVEGAVGGAGGGGARLTVAGRHLLQAADEMTRARAQVLARLAGRKAGAVELAGVAALGLRTSMRNQLPCTVKALKKKGPLVRVELSLADGTVLASRITRESAQLLALAPGLPVLALCKDGSENRHRGKCCRRAQPVGRARHQGIPHDRRRSRIAIGGRIATGGLRCATAC